MSRAEAEAQKHSSGKVGSEALSFTVSSLGFSEISWGVGLVGRGVLPG